MTFNYIAAKRKIFELARAQQFYDPISLRPLSKKFQEEELSAILVMRSQLNRVDWRQVKLWDIEAQSLQNPDKNARARMSDETVGGLFRGRICVANEFPLMTTKLEEVQIWGDMRADVVLYESDRVIVLIESKFGAPFTGRGKHLEDGQLARQAKYLDSLGHIPDKYLMLVSGYEFFDSYWNSSDLFRLKEHRMKEHRKKRKGADKIKFKLLVWEQIISPEWRPPALA